MRAFLFLVNGHEGRSTPLKIKALAVNFTTLAWLAGFVHHGYGIRPNTMPCRGVYATYLTLHPSLTPLESCDMSRNLASLAVFSAVHSLANTTKSF